jgi:hypothetical protein
LNIILFIIILKETLDNLNIPIYEEISKYDNETLEIIADECIRLHYKYGLGIVINNKLHDLFHKLYKKKNNTKEQFLEFITRLEDGEFNNFLNENNLKLDVNYVTLNKVINKNI